MITILWPYICQKMLTLIGLQKIDHANIFLDAWPSFCSYYSKRNIFCSCFFHFNTKFLSRKSKPHLSSNSDSVWISAYLTVQRPYITSTAMETQGERVYGVCSCCVGKTARDIPSSKAVIQLTQSCKLCTQGCLYLTGINIYSKQFKNTVRVLNCQVLA